MRGKLESGPDRDSLNLVWDSPKSDPKLTSFSTASEQSCSTRPTTSTYVVAGSFCRDRGKPPRSGTRHPRDDTPRY